MFQFLRRVSGSLLPRPDRPWRDDATSHAPTIGRKRRYSITEQDDDDPPCTAKRTKNSPAKPDTECDSPSEESPKGDAVPPVGGQEVKEVTKGVEEVDLEDKEENTSSIPPEGVPLPDSPSGSLESESESPEPDAVQENKDREHAGDKNSPTPAPGDVDEEAEAGPITANTNASADGTPPVQEDTFATVESGLHGVPETLEVKA